MTTTSPIADQHGRVMFYCSRCKQPMTIEDFFDLGLRLPDRWETASDYCDAELIDSFEHPDCLRAERAG